VYGGIILQSHLEDHRSNFTRFLLLSQKAVVTPGANKISLLLSCCTSQEPYSTPWNQSLSAASTW
jgi:prephenate dehydratase